MASTDPKTSQAPYTQDDSEKDAGSDQFVEKSDPNVYEDDEYSPAEAKKLIHRVDRRLIVTTGIMYCISLMDRTNLSAAAIAGMLEELRLTGLRYVSHITDI